MALHEFRDAHFKDDCGNYHDLIRDFPFGAPEIVCLCGSTRFYDEFQKQNYRLTMEGKIVLSVGFFPHSAAIHGHGEGVGHDSEEKVLLDELHKRKIDLSDRVFVIDVDGYIGESTASEIRYAHYVEKPVEYLSRYKDIPWQKIPRQRPAPSVENLED